MDAAGHCNIPKFSVKEEKEGKILTKVLNSFSVGTNSVITLETKENSSDSESVFSRSSTPSLPPTSEKLSKSPQSLVWTESSDSEDEEKVENGPKMAENQESVDIFASDDEISGTLQKSDGKISQDLSSFGNSDRLEAETQIPESESSDANIENNKGTFINHVDNI